MFSGKAPRQKIISISFIFFSLISLSGCFTGRAFSSFKCSVTRWEKAADGSWKTVLKAFENGVVGSDYLRVDTVYPEGDKLLRRLYDISGDMYWEFEPKEGKENVCRMWPLEELIWRINETARKERVKARVILAPEPPLTRHERWKYFSGGQKKIRVLETDETLFGCRSDKVLVSVTPGRVWSIWTSPDFPLSSEQSILILTSIGLTPTQAGRLLQTINGFPIDIEMFDVTGQWRMRYSFSQLPVKTTKEDIHGVISAGQMQKIMKREEMIGNEKTLLRLIDGGERLKGTVTDLGLFVRYLSAVPRFNAFRLLKRCVAAKDSLARKYLIYAILDRAKGSAGEAVKQLITDAEIEIARDAAEVLTLFLPKKEAVEHVREVLLRGWKLGLGRKHFLWATDLLRLLTGKDLGYWPGEDNISVIEKWMER